MNKTLDTLLSNMKKDRISINYEELKNKCGYEDIFYANILEPVANKKGYSISFYKDKIIFIKKGE